jgi:hypothetical protein
MCNGLSPFTIDDIMVMKAGKVDIGMMVSQHIMFRLRKR